MSLAVATTLPAYRAAAAELPGSVRLTDDPSGAVVVVDGAGAWWDDATDAAAAGARALLIHEPGAWPAGLSTAVRALAVPVVIARGRLRPDIAADALVGRDGAPVRAMTIDAAARRDEIDSVVRDAIGWARVFARAPLTLRSSRFTDRAVSVLLGDPVCSLTVGVLAADVSGAAVRVDVLGETRTEIEVDPAQSRPRVITVTSHGRLEAPTRYESAERLSLRRAVAAVNDDARSPDLDDLAHDAALARGILDAH